MWQKELQEIQNSVCKTVQNVYMHSVEENLHEAQLLSELIISVTPSECSWILFSLSRPLSSDQSEAFLQRKTPFPSPLWLSPALTRWGNLESICGSSSHEYMRLFV